ncbi:MAG: hypothetical protein LBL52_04305 [Rickettsiales bacterium]|jgi:hypothetical protein|nr:hypothetical protein [Rickettsiales bacterium]
MAPSKTKNSDRDSVFQQGISGMKNKALQLDALTKEGLKPADVPAEILPSVRQKNAGRE